MTISAELGDDWHSTDWEVLVEDLDADGDLDVGLKGRDVRFAVFLADGRGGFDVSWSASYAGDERDAWENPFSGVDLHDIDGDGVLDILAVGRGIHILAVGRGSFETGFVRWFRGRGDGTFDEPSLLIDHGVAAGHAGRMISAGDFDADGKTDFVVNYDAPNSVVVFYGGEESWTPRSLFTSGQTKGSVYAIDIADVDRDEYLDIVVTEDAGGCLGDSCRGRVLVFRNDRTGWFDPEQEVTSRYLYGAVIDDFTDDGVPDFLIYGGGWLSAGIEVISGSSAAIPWRRADANADGNTDLSDAVYVLSYLFLGGRAPPCLKAADANDSGVLDVTDAIYLLTHLFMGGGSPPEPFASCGRDPTRDDLSCRSFPSC